MRLRQRDIFGARFLQGGQLIYGLTQVRRRLLRRGTIPVCLRARPCTARHQRGRTGGIPRSDVLRGRQAVDPRLLRRNITRPSAGLDQRQRRLCLRHLGAGHGHGGIFEVNVCELRQKLAGVHLLTLMHEQ